MANASPSVAQSPSAEWERFLIMHPDLVTRTPEIPSLNPDNTQEIDDPSAFGTMDSMLDVYPGDNLPAFNTGEEGLVESTNTTFPDPLFHSLLGPEGPPQDYLEFSEGLAPAGATIDGNPGRRSRRPRTAAPSPPVWEDNKAKIMEIYFGEGKTLEETRRLMAERHEFDASIPLYKSKFEEWKWRKNIPKKFWPEIRRRVDERRMISNKDSRVKYGDGPKSWTSQEILKKRKRDDEEERPQTTLPVDLPQDLRIETPSIGQISSPSSQHSIPWRGVPNVIPPIHELIRSTSQPMLPPPRPALFGSVPAAPHPLTPQQTAVTYPWNEGQSGPLALRASATNGVLSSLRLNGATISKLQASREEAIGLASAGQRPLAIKTLRDVVSSLSRLLGAANNLARQTAYDLARMLADNREMKEADAVLNWMTKAIILQGGERTWLMHHFLRVIELLRSWGRDADARTLLHRALESSHGGLGFGMFTTIPCSEPHTLRLEDITGDDIDNIFGNMEDVADVHTQLLLIELAIQALTSLEVLEPPIQRIIKACDDLKKENLDLTTESLHAKCYLGKIYSSSSKPDGALSILDSARGEMNDFLDKGPTEVSFRFLEGCRILAFHYRDIGERSLCDDVLETVAGYLETYLGIENTIKDETVILFSISVGNDWHKRSRWSRAKRWFQRALANTVGLEGMDHLVRLLEKSLRLRIAVDMFTAEWGDLQLAR